MLLLCDTLSRERVGSQGWCVSLWFLEAAELGEGKGSAHRWFLCVQSELQGPSGGLLSS